MVRKALALLPLLLVACVAPEEDDVAQAGTDALSQGEGTVYAGTDRAEEVEVTFRIEGASGKRAAWAHFRRGAGTVDLECSQKMKIDVDPASDDVETLCVERGGSDAVGLRVLYRPSTKWLGITPFVQTWKTLSSSDRELYRLLAAVDAPKLRDELKVKVKALATDPLTDPIALGKAVHPNLRTSIGLSVVDRRPGRSATNNTYTIELVSATTNFATLESTLVLNGPETGHVKEVVWHNDQSITVPLLKAPGKLGSEADTRLAILEKLRAL